MTRALAILVTVATLLLAPPPASAEGFDHAYTTWDKVLRRHVDDRGRVDYAAVAEDPGLDAFLAELAAVPPDRVAAFSDEQKVAFYVNAYNAITFATIVAAMPTDSIRDIRPDPWEATRWTVGGRRMSLNEIEHKKLRRDLSEPRVHFVLVCAAVSCPVLPDRAVLPEGLDEQLERAARAFFTDPARNRVDRSSRKVYLSRILDWYGDDFIGAEAPELKLDRLDAKEAAVVRTMAKYLGEADRAFLAEGDFTIVLSEYDWSLNGR